MFDVLSPEVIKQIVNIRVAVVQERLALKGITLEISDEALAYLAKEGYNPHYGARPLNRIIQSKILNQVAAFIISNNTNKGDTVLVGIKNGELIIETKKNKTRKASSVVSRTKMPLA
jgi:ATP-dependent Clp protease ATP-binding subunit ClpA